MIKGIFTSASGMIPHVRRQEVVANNMANASTSGFKKDRIFTQELNRAESKQQSIRSDWQVGNIGTKVHIDFQPGAFDKTGNPLDLAIEAEGFFVLQSPDGQQVLTRSGAFEVDANGFLSHPGGFQLMGEGGPIQVGSGQLNVDFDGQVQVNGTLVDQIIPKTVEDLETLERLGGSLFAIPEGVELIPGLAPRIIQGYVERANVDIVREMVDMIISQRAYESNARALQFQDDSLGQLLGRVAGDR